MGPLRQRRRSYFARRDPGFDDSDSSFRDLHVRLMMQPPPRCQPAATLRKAFAVSAPCPTMQVMICTPACAGV